MTDHTDHIVITGVIHVHTTDSDGAKSHEEVAAIGREIGLDFLLFADHMTLKGKQAGKEGFYGDLLAIIGYEHNDHDDCNHYLIFDHDEVFPSGMTAAEYVAAAAARGALGIMAHPDEIRGREARYRSYPWTDWTVSGFDGLEIWNQMSEWMENLKVYNQIRMVLSPRKFLTSPTARILRRWDELNRTRKVAGVGAVDAHGFLYRAGLLRLTIFPYKVQFKTLRTHLLLPQPLSSDPATARRQVFDAIRDCRIFISNYRWGDARDFRFTISTGTEQAAVGGTVTLDGQTQARVSTPLPARFRLIVDGEPVAEGQGREWVCSVKRPGLYRIEAYHGRKGWIFSNHIRVQSD